MIFNSIRSRLTAWHVAVLGFFLILFSILLYVFLSKRLHESIDNSLKVSANVIQKAALLEYSRTPLPGLDLFFDQFLGYSNINKFYRIYDGSGHVDSRSKGIDASKFPLTQDAYSRATQGKMTYETFKLVPWHRVRVITMPVIRNDNLVNLIQVGTSLMAVEHTLKNLRIFLFTAIPCALILSTLGGRFMATRALKPVAEITSTAQDIAHGANLSRRIPIPEVQDEIGNLARTFNEMMNRLEKSFNQVRQFSSDASHELRTPLTVLKGQSELVLSKPRSKAEYQEVLSSNLEEINYMSRVLEDLLILSKGDEGKVSLEKEPVELSSIVEEVSRQGEIFADEKEVKIILAYLEPVTILGDAHRLKQMVWILLHNAVKFTPSGGEIKITLQDLDDTVYFTIRDTGIGIPEQDLPKIFDRFYRVDKARSRMDGGSGLGLSICKHIVDRHHGTVDVESKFGEGTKFKIRFPKYEVAQRKTA
ncbi:MAG: heavy metal sensor histidine kinase [Nitrospinae bacterium]|nr:heavy metal sensor histidine kinase [Nitrospinota bacterium]